MARISFDSVSFPDVEIEISGTVYRVPSDIPIPMIQRVDATVKAVFAADDESDEAGERVMELYELLLELFRVRQPDLESLPIAPRQIFSLAHAVLNPEGFLEEEAKTDPTRPARPGGTRTKNSSAPRAKKTKPKTTKRSTSSTSRAA